MAKQPMGLGLLLLILGLDSVTALCPYHMLWHPDSPYKLSDDHPALQGGYRSLLAEGTNDAGAGSCIYTNPFSQTKDCIQYTGADWTVKSAEEACTVTGPMAGVSGAEYSEGLCEGYSSDMFGGVCLNDEGKGTETETVFLSDALNPMTSCGGLVTACETFAGGRFDRGGGVCEEEGDKKEGRKKKVAGKRAKAAKSTDECQISPGIAGGGHIHVDSYWSENCENQDNEYAMPLRWAADLESIMIQKGGRSMGRTFYDVKNNRKRFDVVTVWEESTSSFFNSKNTTTIHIHDKMITMDWDTGKCSENTSPVGNIRSNWVLDSHGGGSTSQYLGSAFVLHEGKYKNVKQWRKTEPLENAFMIQSYDNEYVWQTPEGKKRRVLTRQTPGAPGQGDTIDLFYNHTTDFDDSVFNILDEYECSKRETQFNISSTTNFEGLNTNSSLHIDSGFVRVECGDCGLIYTDAGADKEKEAPKADTDSELKPKPKPKSFSGSEVIREEGKLELAWEYSSEENSFTFWLKSEEPMGWLSISFPEFNCAMVPGDAVIGALGVDSEEGEVSAYRMTVATLSGVTVDNGQMIEDALMEDVDGLQTLKFVRKADNGGNVVLDPSGPIDVNWATGQSVGLGYHGSDGRGCITINN